MEREARGKRRRTVRLSSEQLAWFVSVMNEHSAKWLQEEFKKRYNVTLSKKELYTRRRYYRSRKREEKEIICRQCGTVFVVRAYQDRRTTYCSKRCEKRYWKKPPKRTVA